MSHLSSVLGLVIFLSQASGNIPNCPPCYCYREVFAPLSDTDDVFIANCSNLGLTFVPSIHPEALVLDLSNNLLKSFPMYLQPRGMRALILSGNNFSPIPQFGIGSGHENLEYLELLGTKLKLEKNGFSPGFKSLVHVKLEINHMAEDVFKNLTSLKSLYLKTSPDIPPKLFQSGSLAENLQTLMLEASEVPTDLLAPLTQLSELHLILPPTVTSLSPAILSAGEVENTLRKLVIKSPDLVINRSLLMNIEKTETIELWLNASSLPNDTFYLSTAGYGTTYSSTPQRYFLKNIVIVGVDEIPSKLFQYVPKLQSLQLIDTGPPPEDLLDDVAALQSVTLMANGMHDLAPELLRKQKRLTHLTVERNELTNIGASDFESLTSLEYLSLARNKLNRLDEAAFHSMRTSLVSLDLSHNFICHLPKDIFAEMTQLKYLHHQFNCLDELSPMIFQDLGELTHLYLQVNNLSIIPEGLFSNLGKLEVLNLNNNTIVGISRATLEELYSNTKSVTIENNLVEQLPVFHPPENATLEYFLVGHIKCDCGVVPLIKIKVLVGFCANPGELRGIEIKKLDPLTVCPEEMTTSHYTDSDTTIGVTRKERPFEVTGKVIECRGDTCEEKVEPESTEDMTDTDCRGDTCEEKVEPEKPTENTPRMTTFGDQITSETATDPTHVSTPDNSASDSVHLTTWSPELPSQSTNRNQYTSIPPVHVSVSDGVTLTHSTQEEKVEPEPTEDMTDTDCRGDTCEEKVEPEKPTENTPRMTTFGDQITSETATDPTHVSTPDNSASDSVHLTTWSPELPSQSTNRNQYTSIPPVHVSVSDGVTLTHSTQVQETPASGTTRPQDVAPRHSTAKLVISTQFPHYPSNSDKNDPSTEDTPSGDQSSEYEWIYVVHPTAPEQKPGDREKATQTKNHQSSYWIILLALVGLSGMTFYVVLRKGRGKLYERTYIVNRV